MFSDNEVKIGNNSPIRLCLGDSVYA